MTRIIALGLSGVAFFLFVFMVGLRVHFPGEQARDRLAFEVQEASGGAWLLCGSAARPYRLVGLAMDDVVLFKRAPKGRGAAAEQDAVPFLRFERLGARPLWLPLLKGERAAALDIGLLGGDLDLELRSGERSQRLVLDGQEIDISRLPLEGEEWSVDARGMLTVEADLSIGTEDVKESEGTLRLQIADLLFQEATIMGMTLEPTPFTEALLAFEVKEGRAEVTEGRFASDPVTIAVSGEIVLNKSWERSRLRLDFSVTFNEQFDKMARLVPDLKAARNEDGAYLFKLTGTLDNPRFREQRSSARGKSTITRKGDGEDKAIGAPSGGDDAEADRRREERRERIAERRRRMQEDGAELPTTIPRLPGDKGPLPGPGRFPNVVDPDRFGDGEDIVDVELGRPDLSGRRLDMVDEPPPLEDEELPLEENFEEQLWEE